MIGMIKKDIMMVINNYKSILICLAVYILYFFMFEMDLSFFLPFLGIMVCISTMNYDEYNNWHTYSATLPQGRVNVVRSKYITAIGVTLVFTILSIVVSFILGSVKGTLNIEETFGSLVGMLFGIVILMSLLFPLLFKYGYEKGRIAMVVIGLGIFGIGLLIKNVVNIDVPADLIKFLDSYFPYIFAVVSIIFVTISYLVSKRIYLHREF